MRGTLDLLDVPCLLQPPAPSDVVQRQVVASQSVIMGRAIGSRGGLPTTNVRRAVRGCARAQSWRQAIAATQDAG